MVWSVIWVHPYTVRHVQVGGWFLFWGGRSEPEWCCNVMVEATAGFRLDPTSILDVYKVFWKLEIVWMAISILDVYKVFWHLDILFIGIWVSTLTLLGLCRWGVGFFFWGVDLSLSDVVMSWLRLQQASDCIPHPYWMYTQCFGSLRWCEWAYESSLTLLGLCRWGAYFGFLVVHLSLRDVVVVMSWLRLQQASYWIPHPYWMYAKCFGTLIWCEWSYGSTPYTVRHVQGGGLVSFFWG